MKTTLLLSLILQLSLFFTAPANALGRRGTSIGNGGVTVSCVQEDGSVVLDLLDLWDAKKLYHYRAPHLSNNADPLQVAIDYAQIIDTALENSDDPYNVTFQTMEDRVNYFARKMDFKNNVPESNDTREILEFSSNCSPVQVVNFMSPTHIEVDIDVWSDLSVINRAALYLHEAIYWYLRDRNGADSDSRRTRHAVGYILSNGKLDSPFKLPNDARNVQFCHSIKGDSKTWATQLFAYRAMDGKLTMQFIQLDGFRMLTKTTASGVGPAPEGAANPMESKSKFVFSSRLKSILDQEGGVRMTWSGNAHNVHLTGLLQEYDVLNDDLTCEALR